MKNGYLYYITFAAVSGGLLFGLNMSGISGANEFIKNEFGLSEASLGTVVALLTGGCLFGSLFAGRFADKFGRRKILIATTLLYMVSAAGCALSTSVMMLNVFRFTSGLAVGSTSVVGPMYVSEISPAKRRGQLVALNQFAITVGILLGYFSDYLLIDSGAHAWRYMLAVPAIAGIPGLAMMIVSLPESPRWLSMRGNKYEATKVSTGISKESGFDDSAYQEEVPTVEKSNKSVKIRDLFKGKIGKAVFIGSMVAVFQQLTGINAIIMFSSDIFTSSGAGNDKALLGSMLIGAINMIMTIIAIRLVDTKGRKTLLLWGSIGMTVALSCLAVQFSFSRQNDFAVLIALLVYISFFASSFAPVMWIIISEIYPSEIKGAAMSFASALCWLSAFLVVKYTPVVKSLFGIQWLFAVFALFAAAAFIFVKTMLPETKGKSFEQIERELELR